MLARTAAILLVAAAVLPARAEQHRVRTREGYSYELYVPTGVADNATTSSSHGASLDQGPPLLLLFHWSTGRGASILESWTELAERLGFIVIAPDGRHRMRWTKRDMEDVLDALVAVGARYQVDPDRIYAAGFSSGANFAYRLMAANPGLLRAIAPFSGRMRATDEELGNRLSSNGATRVCVWHGTSDRTIRYRNAREAVERLSSYGYDVHLHTLRQGHWFDVGQIPTMWECMDGARNANES